MPRWFQILFWLLVAVVYAIFGFISIAASVGGSSGAFPVGVLVQVLACFVIPTTISLIYILKNRPAAGYVWLFSAIPLFVACSLIYITIFEK